MQEDIQSSNGDDIIINDPSVEATFGDDDDWDSFIDEVLPNTPESCNFSKIEFSGSTFNVESFIEKRKNEPLEALRQSLSQYLTKLNQTTTDIVNEEYAAFIQVSNNITAVGPSIDRVIQPLVESRQRLLSFRNELNGLATDLEAKLSRLKEISRQKRDMERMKLLHHRLQDLESRLELLKSDPRSMRGGLRYEKFSCDLLQTERLLKSIKNQCPLLMKQQEHFSRICHETSKLHVK